MPSQRIVAGAIALLLALGSGIWFGGRPEEPPPLIVTRSADEHAGTPAATITVHVSGAVARPGLVDLADGSRVADALAAAGGVLASADLSALNLAAPAGDGTLIVVPRAGTADGPAPAAGDGRVRLNLAGVDEMATLPGIGPVLAQRIVDYRDEYGPFDVVEDLLDVPGIGEAKLAMLRDAVVVP